MAFKNVRFPIDISVGVSGGPEYSTDIVVSGNGREKRNANWAVPLYSFDAAHGIKTQSMMNDLVAFFRLMNGRLHTFRFKNWAEYTINNNNYSWSSDGIFNGGEIYQIHRKIQFLSEQADYHKITKIVSGTFKVFLDAVEISNTLYTVNYETGIVTFNAVITKTITAITNTSNGVVTATAHGLVTGDKVVLENVIGINLNNQIATITKIDDDLFYLNINTTSLGTFTSGDVVKYIEQGTYTFNCEFDFHCRFDTDSMKYNIDSYSVYSWNQIPVKEVRE